MTRDLAQKYDQEDPLRSFRKHFIFPKTEVGTPCLYFCGNSLGLQPKKCAQYIQEELDNWGRLGVEGHFKSKFPWLPYHEFVAPPLARLVGAKETEVVAMNTLSANLHFMMTSFYRPTSKRFKIIIEKDAFPSDIYAVKSQLRFHGYPEGLVELTNPSGEGPLAPEYVLEQIAKHADSTALILLGGVNYLTGQVFDFKSITEFGHGHGITVGFDLAHAAGNLHLKLHEWGVDFATWCHYKYVNGGPGTIGGCFIHERHHGKKDIPRFEGWWGQDKSSRFQMGPEFEPIPTAEAWQLSNPPIFQLAALRASLSLFDETSMEALREKSVKLTGYLEKLLKKLPGKPLEIVTPTDPTQRGCQLSLKLGPDAKQIVKSLENKGVIADFREPNIMRVAPVPLYNSFEDVYQLACILKGVE